jgi:hypothetical protein
MPEVNFKIVRLDRMDRLDDLADEASRKKDWDRVRELQKEWEIQFCYAQIEETKK